MTDLIARCDAARDFPRNTCGASRVAFEIGLTLWEYNNVPSAISDLQTRQETGEAILATVAALWETRTALRKAQRLEGKW